jgi:hypothetical protein
MQTNEELVDELLKNELFLDTFGHLRNRFSDVPPQILGEALIIGVMYERGMIIKEEQLDEQD